ncbi:MAG TPA: hypothetical protein VH253_09285, partial [Phycisphaerae bacterium]|nr:hypothetical protein [Phycisphaerae bacterium]
MLASAPPTATGPQLPFTSHQLPHAPPAHEPTDFAATPAAKRARSLRPIFDHLTAASTSLDDILHTLELSKEEAEALLLSQQYQTHRQLRTTLLAQQLQLIAQNHA